MFESLTNSLTGFFNGIHWRGKQLTEENIDTGLQEVRTALLEADVALPIVREFIQNVKTKAVGQEVIKAVRPADQIVKIVHDEILRLLGQGDTKINYNPNGPTVIMMAGLQGSGKTTTCGKLARLLRSQGRRPLLVAADLQRPAAPEQLKVLGTQVQVPVLHLPDHTPLATCEAAIAEAKKTGRDVVILDTAGRLAIDETLMTELEQIKTATKPQEIFLVVDSMAGQDAVNSAKAFNERLQVTGFILTKMDSDARGGVALSLRSMAGAPIKYVGVGEILDKLEDFNPEGMATRILGMGDIVSLVKKAEEVMDETDAARFQERMLNQTLSLEDFLTQLRTLSKMGSLKDLIGMIPGFSQLRGMNISDKQLKRVEAIILSMTPDERRNPNVLDKNKSRIGRIAKGSGAKPEQVIALLKQFDTIKRGLSNAFKAQQMVDTMVPGVQGPLGQGQSRPAVTTSIDRRRVEQRRAKEKKNKQRRIRR
ncbi:MAG TPA: signal recognition particle protein [Planctomycetota bacterium]|nr:signal recognition particle protein [Planctomycetota bacterium]